MPPRRSRTLILLLALCPLGCGDDGGGGGDGSDTGQPGPNPQIEGDLCGDVTDEGFQIACIINSFSVTSNNSAVLGQLTGCGSCGVGLGFLFPNAEACCEGEAVQATADAECDDVCQRAACERAKDAHNNVIADSCAGAVFGGNGFDMTGCLSGNSTNHTFDCTAFCNWFGSGSCGDNYNLQVACNASSNEPVDADGTFSFIQEPDNDPLDDPPTCDHSQALVLSPDGYALQDSAQEGLGSRAEVTWTFGEESGFESTTDLDIDVSYNVVPCSQGSCLQLAQLDLATSDLTVEGIAISSVRMSVIGLSTEPAVNGNGNFSFPEGSLEILVEYVVVGSRQQLVGTNAATASGRILPGSNHLTLSDLRFAYSGSGVTASLEVDIVGAYTKRAPVASFVPVSVPRSCSAPVVFDATSTDADNDPLTHVWEIDGDVAATGASLSTVLTPGAHTIVLLTQDDDLRSDLEVLDFVRSCE